MGREIDRIPDRVACLNTEALPATLVATRGFNCEVWRSAGVFVTNGKRVAVDFVIKRHRLACEMREIALYRRDYDRLRDALGDIVPSALFVATRIDGEPNVVALAEACAPWFDLARPSNEGEARPLLERMPKARDEIRRFATAARAWLADGRLIDLYGDQNLVLDRSLRVRYLDSFGVFFYPDMLHAVADVDDTLAMRIEISLARLDYVESLAG